ncbi:cobalamin B12-binding domain-containing protein [Primorskyibacter sp. S187A]|uniref:cobalamin B12-binding domain-containing protein n=1 Tax=Primorskyibacter sp. S187A TaxID=3415130 RepID=UPI003C79C37C
MDQRTKTKEAEGWPTAQTIQGLAREVVSRMGQQVQPSSAVRVSVLDKLVTQILTRGLFDAERIAAILRSQRLSDLETLHHYIPTAARRLGQMWSEDIIGFAEVSIGTARLQALAHEIASHGTMESDRAAPQDISILVVTDEAEDHSLGAVTLCTLLRRRGYNTHLRLGVNSNALVAEFKNTQHDVVMFSCSRPEGLASLARTIKDVRRRVGNATVLAVGGVVLDHASDIQEKTGADLVTRDMNQVLKLAMSFRKGRISVVR